ncbi:integrase [Gossypium australe]|uniref:Integrase n=1 Tax=Gossypium australe TaxID=47621 RepID=A0A5B6WMV8_9ROSI|nr:integrase [Gossypium australe]
MIGFVNGLPLTPTKKDSIWVIVDRLTKSAHFLPVREDYSLQKLANEVIWGAHINYFGLRSPFYISILEEGARFFRNPLRF